jgi:CBS domain-containing protein
MICGTILSPSIPTIQLSDTIGEARQLMEDIGLENLPVLEDNLYKGLLDLSDIDIVDDKLHISGLTERLSQTFVWENDFFLAALKKVQDRHFTCIPVINNTGEYLGAITLENLIEAATRYLSAAEPGGIIILQMPAQQFSISELGRIVESNNGKILHLTTWTDPAMGELMVAIKLNKIDIQDILASFERYQFTVYQYFGENLSEDTLKNNFDNLMNYLRF